MDDVSRKSSEILQAVSRSFALCIPLLEENKVREVENMYLMSRVADTIEDSSLPVERKKALMGMFFRTLVDKNAIDEFLNELREGTIDEHDKILTIKENYTLILDIFHSLDKRVQDISVKFLTEMSFGMMKYLEKEVRTFSDLNEYCYYVAGTVGLYMNELIELKDNVRLDREKAISMGRYLQKINIIKNFRKDQKEERNFWPITLFDRLERKELCNGHHKEEAMPILEKLINSAAEEAREAFDYIASVPSELTGYRKFLLLSAFMASESLHLMHNNPEVFTNPEGVKISRARMGEIFGMVEKAAVSNDLLWKTKQELEPKIIA